MKTKLTALLIVLFIGVSVYGQDSIWVPVKIDDNLSVRFPKKYQKLDTSFTRENQTYEYQIIKAETKIVTLGVTVTPNGTGINVDNEESLRSVLDSFERGTCKGFMNKGLTCKSKDSLLDGLPCKKFEASFAGFKDPLIYNYALLVNDKMYMFTITTLLFTQDKTKLNEESARFLNGIRFTKSVKEKQFATRVESGAYKFGYYLVPFLLIVGFVVFVVVRITRS